MSDDTIMYVLAHAMILAALAGFVDPLWSLYGMGAILLVMAIAFVCGAISDHRRGLKWWRFP